MTVDEERDEEEWKEEVRDFMFAEFLSSQVKVFMFEFLE